MVETIYEGFQTIKFIYEILSNYKLNFNFFQIRFTMAKFIYVLFFFYKNNKLSFVSIENPDRDRKYRKCNKGRFLFIIYSLHSMKSSLKIVNNILQYIHQMKEYIDSKLNLQLNSRNTNNLLKVFVFF